MWKIDWAKRKPKGLKIWNSNTVLYKAKAKFNFQLCWCICFSGITRDLRSQDLNLSIGWELNDIPAKNVGCICILLLWILLYFSSPGLELLQSCQKLYVICKIIKYRVNEYFSKAYMIESKSKKDKYIT